MLKHILIAAFGIAILGVVAHQAQNKPDTRPFPGVFVTDSNGKPRPLHVRTLKANVNVRGTLATTTLEITVYNPHNRVLEGEFSFPVADGQTVSRFALDINGHMREAVVVDKTTGRKTFEEVIRTKVDPALLEWTRDNSFRARIYPINPHSTRTIIIAYEQQLIRTDAGFGYTIPFAFPEPIDSFTFHADVAAFGTRPSLAGDGGDKIQFAALGRTFVADLARTNMLLNKPFTLSVPVVLDNHIVSTNTFRGDTYLGIFMALKPNAVTVDAPKRMALVWDASLSRLQRDVKKEDEFLMKLFTQTRDADVDLSVFSNDVMQRSTHSVRNGDWTALRRVLNSIDYDGGTQLSSAPLNTTSAEMILLFSDGISTFGEHHPVLGNTPVYAVSSSVNADHTVMRSISQQTGGAFIDLTARGMEDAVGSLFEQRSMIKSIRVVDGTVEDLRPALPIEVSDVTPITGRLISSSATLIVTTELDGSVESVDTIIIDNTLNGDEGNAMARLWAQYELQRLGADRSTNKEAIKALGMRFGVITPGTSLIVLERLEDFVRFNIEPPATEPDLVAQWKSQRALITNDSLGAIRRHQDFVKNLTRSERTRIDQRRRQDSTTASISRLPKAKLWGTVKDEKGKIINDATISLNNNPFNNIIVYDTTSNGAFMFTGLTPGTVELSANAPGYYGFTQRVEVAPGATLSHDFKLVKASTRDRKALLGKSGSGAKRGTIDFYESNGGTTASAPASVQMYGNTVRGETLDAMSIDDGASTPIEVTAQREMIRSTSIGSNRVVRDDRDQAIAQEEVDDSKIVIAAPQSRSKWTGDLAKTSKGTTYMWYLKTRANYKAEASFYLDVADKLAADGNSKEALRVLSCLAELHGEDSRTLRILAHRLLQLGFAKYAVYVFRDVKDVREEEPQSWRDLGLALTAAGEHQEAAEMFSYMIDHEWHNRFPEVELIAIHELNRLLGVAGSKIDRSKIDPSYIVKVEYDLRVVLSWDADNCDMDLWVTDPDGETCLYSHRLTSSGGCMSRDLTGGYGPEEFTLPLAKAGTYNVQVHYYGTRQQDVERPTTIQVALFKNYNRKNEKHDAVTMRLDGAARVVDVGKITVN